MYMDNISKYASLTTFGNDLAQFRRKIHALFAIMHVFPCKFLLFSCHDYVVADDNNQIDVITVILVEQTIEFFFVRLNFLIFILILKKEKKKLSWY